VSALEIAAFESRDQDAVRALILDGLEGHWGTIDPGLNPDLDDIATSYRAGRVLVARRDGRVVGAGAVVPVGAREGEVKRLGVAREQRRSGIATALLREMVAFAADTGWHALVLETTASWTDAVGLYETFGFTLTHYDDGEFGRDAWFRLEIQSG
jgi:ribosomal protein S18 acetylase RimI-like enzyme